MSETIRIVGLSVKADKLKKMDYEKILKLALRTPKYYKVKGAENEIKKILEENGLFKKVPARSKGKNKSIKPASEDKSEHSEEPKPDSKSSKGEMETRS